MMVDLSCIETVVLKVLKHIVKLKTDGTFTSFDVHFFSEIHVIVVHSIFSIINRCNVTSIYVLYKIHDGV